MASNKKSHEFVKMTERSTPMIYVISITGKYDNDHDLGNESGTTSSSYRKLRKKKKYNKVEKVAYFCACCCC